MVVPPYMAWLGEQREQRTGMRPVTRLLKQASGGQVRGTGHIGSTPRTRRWRLLLVHPEGVAQWRCRRDREARWPGDAMGDPLVGGGTR